MIGRLLLFLAMVALGVAPLSAALVPIPSIGDPRVRTVLYSPYDVVRLEATLGYAVTVQFGPGERIETISIGDSVGWQVTPNRRADLLFVKPIAAAPPTNMTIVTNLRMYTIDLRVRHPVRGHDGDLIFVLKFDYPEPASVVAEPVAPPPEHQPPRDVNHAYSFSGSDRGLPTRVFDDGESTYFAFPATAEFPAIFAVDADRKEAAVNVAQRDGFVVVDRLAATFVLRRGAEVTQIINGGFHPDAAAISALPRHRKR